MHPPFVCSLLAANKSYVPSSYFPYVDSNSFPRYPKIHVALFPPPIIPPIIVGYIILYNSMYIYIYISPMHPHLFVRCWLQRNPHEPSINPSHSDRSAAVCGSPWSSRRSRIRRSSTVRVCPLGAAGGWEGREGREGHAAWMALLRGLERAKKIQEDPNRSWLVRKTPKCLQEFVVKLN